MLIFLAMMTPQTILADEDFSFRDADSVIALIASCVRHGVDPASLPLDRARLASLPPDRFQAYLDDLVDASRALYGQDAVRGWLEAVQEVEEAARGVARWVAQSLLSPACAQVIAQGLEVLSQVHPVALPLPATVGDTDVHDQRPIEAPSRPLRAALYALRRLLQAAEEAPLTEDQRRQAVESVERLRSPEALRYFAAGVTALEAEEPCDDDRDFNLLDALALRNLGANLYALDGDEALLHALERVDGTLNDPRYRDALLSVDEDRWAIGAEDRVPSEHWWGVRTRAEMFGAEFASEIADALAAQGAPVSKKRSVKPPWKTSLWGHIPGLDPVALEAARHASASAMIPQRGAQNRPRMSTLPPLWWQDAKGDRLAMLSFTNPDQPTLRCWVEEGTVLRVMLADVERNVTHENGQWLARFTRAELEGAHGTDRLAVLSVEVQRGDLREWLWGLLSPTNEG